MLFSSFGGFFILLPDGGWGWEKELGIIYNIGGIFLLTVFFIADVVGFWIRGWICALGIFTFFV